MNKKFYNQYKAIIRAIEEGYRQQGDIASYNSHIVSRPTIINRLREMVAAGVLDRYENPVSYSVLHLSPFADLETAPKAAPQPTVVPVQATFVDRVAAFLRTSDKPWQSVNKIAATFGIEADAVEVEMDATCVDQPERFRSINLERVTMKKFDIANDNTVRFYGLVERIEKAATTPVEPVEIVEAPVASKAAEVPVEAPEPVLTLQQIIEQATQAAIELTSRDRRDEVAAAISERDAALNKLAAFERLFAQMQQMVG